MTTLLAATPGTFGVGHPLNGDGVRGFSADDWLAAAQTSVVLAAYADLRGPPEARRLAQTGAWPPSLHSSSTSS